eukprot:3343958-Pleurochrysis_carterae.AAC.9
MANQEKPGANDGKLLGLPLYVEPKLDPNIAPTVDCFACAMVRLQCDNSVLRTAVCAQRRAETPLTRAQSRETKSRAFAIKLCFLLPEAPPPQKKRARARAHAVHSLRPKFHSSTIPQPLVHNQGSLQPRQFAPDVQTTSALRPVRRLSPSVAAFDALARP